MPNELMVVQVGQCGSRLGFEFWKRLSEDHGISPKGMFQFPKQNGSDKKNIFFRQFGENHYIPRSIFIDTESQVIDDIKDSAYSKLFDLDNFFVSKEEEGCANNWFYGYSDGQRNQEEILQLLLHESEASDHFEGFVLCHSIGGGTGSGLGSFLLESIRDYFPKKIVQTYSVFPDMNDFSDDPSLCLNSVLTLKRLAQNPHAVVVFDNTALSRILEKNFTEDSSFSKINSLLSKVMTSCTSTLRYQDCMGSTLRSLITPLVPNTSLNFIMTGYVPMVLDSVKNKGHMKNTLASVLKELLQPRNMLASVDSSSSYISIADIIHGKVEYSEIQKTLRDMRKKNYPHFIKWAPDSIRALLGKSSPYKKASKQIRGVMLANHTGINLSFKNILSGCEKLLKTRKPPEDHQCSDVFSELKESMECLELVCDQYDAATQPDYQGWSP